VETWTRASHGRWPARFIDLRKVDITPAQCALGFRAAMVMINLGVKVDNFESFISEVYNHSKDLGVSRENIATHMKDLVGFSKTVPVSLSL
jgi:hypothetical protein